MRSSIRALRITNTPKKKEKEKTKGAAKAKQSTKFSHSTPTECKAATKKMKKRKRRDASAAEHEITRLQLCLYHLATQKQKTDRWSDGKIPREVTDWAGRTGKIWLEKSRTAGFQCLPPGWIRGGNVAQIRSPRTR
jgi:hypothetical protein